MRYCVLGPLRVRDLDAGHVIELGPKVRRLLAVLLLAEGDVVAVDRLVAALWGDEPPADPRAALQVHVVRLRRLVGSDLRTVPPGYSLVLQDGQSDLAQFSRLLATARSLAADGLVGDAASTLQSARDLWYGEPVDGLDGPGFDGSVRRLRRLREQAEDDHAELLLRLGGRDDLVTELEDRVAEHPARARAWDQLVRALVVAGRPGEARARVEAARALGVDLTAGGSTGVGGGATASGRDVEADPLRTRIRALLSASHPHPLPTAVLVTALQERRRAVEATLRGDPACSGGGRVTSWRLREDVRVDVVDATVDDLVDATLAVADAAREQLMGPDIAAAAATAAAVSPVLEGALRDGRRAPEIAATMGRWWSLQARRDLTGVLAHVVLQQPDPEDGTWQTALGWTVDLARRAGDGRLVDALVASLPGEPPRDPVAAAKWSTTRGHAAEFADDVDGSIRWFLDAADRWADVGNGHHEAVACCNAAINCNRRGDRDVALRLLHRARSIPAAVVGPLPRHAVTMTEAHLCIDAGELHTARDLALQAEERLRGVVDRLADNAAILAAEVACLRGHTDEARRVLARCGATVEGHNRVNAGVVRAEVELADGHPGRAVQVLETLWADEGEQLRSGAGEALVGTYARAAAASGRPDLAADLLRGAPRAPGPWGRLDDELRRRVDGAASSRAPGATTWLEDIGRVRDALLATDRAWTAP